MRSDTARRLVADHGPFQNRLVCEFGPHGSDGRRKAFLDAGGLTLVEAVLARAGLLDLPGYWLLRPTAAADPAGPAVAVKEATTVAVRLVVRPGDAHAALDCLLLVHRDKGDPREVRKKLKDAVAQARATETPAPEPAPPEPPPVVVETRVQPRPPADPEAAAIYNNPATYKLVVDAVDAAQPTTSLYKFLMAVAWEFGPDHTQQVWGRRLAALARCGLLEERRTAAGLSGYTVTEAGRKALDRRSSESLHPIAGRR